MHLYLSELVWTSLTGFSLCCYYRQLLSNVEVLSLGPFYWPLLSVASFFPSLPVIRATFFNSWLMSARLLQVGWISQDLKGYTHPWIPLFSHPCGHVDPVAQPPKKCCSSLDLAKCSCFLETLWFGLMPFFFLVINAPDSRIFFLLPSQPEDFMSCNWSGTWLGSISIKVKDDPCIPLTIIEGTVWLKNYNWSPRKFTGCIE